MAKAAPEELGIFYALLTKGASVLEFKTRYEQLFKFVHAAGLTEELRLGREPVKRLRDEVMPMRLVIDSCATNDDQVQFPLDSGPTDCSIKHADGRQRKIQLTGGERSSRLQEMRKLNKDGEASSDYSTAEAKERIFSAIRECLENKKNDFGNDTLVIDLSFGYLSKEHWEHLLPDIKSQAASSQFSEIFIVSCNDERICVQVKELPAKITTKRN